MGRAFEGVHDRVFARALYLSSEGEKRGIALISTDLLLIPNEMRAEIARRLETLNLGGFLLCATHTHSGPGNYFDNALGELAATGGYRKEVFDFLCEKIAESVFLAKKNIRTARFAAVRGSAEGLNRHRRAEDGDTDPELVLIRFEGEDGKGIGDLISFAAHPTVLGASNYLLSGDFPGALCREIEAKRETVAFFLNAGCAELKPVPPQGGEDFVAVQSMGVALAEKALELGANLQMTRELPFGFRSQRFQLPRFDASSVIFFPFDYLLTPWLDYETPDQCLLQTIQLGDVILAGFPCDFGVKLGKQLKSSRHGITIPIGYADGFIGYAVDECSYRQGWYESRLSFYGPGLGQFLVENSLSLFP